MDVGVNAADRRPAPHRDQLRDLLLEVYSARVAAGMLEPRVIRADALPFAR